MGKVLIAVIFLVIGVIAGVMGSSLMVGTAAGVGIATGFTAGACGVVRAARDEGLLSEEQVDQVFNRGIANLRELVPDTAEAEPVAGSAAECDAALARLREAIADRQGE